MFRSKITTMAAFTALAVAVLGATPVGHAAGKLVLGKGSIGTSQLKRNAVTSTKVKNRSLLGSSSSGASCRPARRGRRATRGRRVTRAWRTSA